MKNFLLLTSIITLFLSTSIFAQDQSNSSPFTFGTEIGATVGSPIGPAEKGAKGKLGLGPTVGIFARYEINPRWNIQTGLNYIHKKATYSSPVNDQSYDYIYEQEVQGDILVFEIEGIILNGSVRGEFNNKYIQAPIIGFYNFNDRFSINGGYYIAYLISAGHDVWATGVLGNNFTTLDDYYSNEKESIAQWDHGASIGANYKLRRQLEAELNISTGFSSVFSDDYQAAEDTIRNTYLTLKVNYTFQL